MIPKPVEIPLDLKRYFVMTLLVTTLYFTSLTAFQLPIWSLTFAALLLGERVIQHWGFWTALVTLMVVAIGQMYLPEGNDFYLILYLALNALIATHRSDSLTVIRKNATCLIGIVFGLATLWKLISPTFISGTYFTYQLLYEERLAPLTLFFAKLPLSEYLANHNALENINLDTGFSVYTTPTVRIMALMLTWLAISVEGIVALAFLVPHQSMRYIRDPLLLVFFAGSYLIMPVPSFGMALATLGYVQAANSLYKKLYLASYIVMPLTALRVILTAAQ